PTREPTVAPTEEPTQEPTAVPTEESEPTDVPAEQSTPEPTTANPTEVSKPQPTAEPTRVPQEPSVEPDSTPEQPVGAAWFRASLDGASVGASVPELPQINPVGNYGEWVVLNVYGRNMSSDPQTFDMSTFRLEADGQEINVDVGNAWV